ncbi:alpha/beta hydrolase [Gordonia sp. (in: high G+C Gram-positive bacteria)]|uniref:alpha/beta hydrolase n=1 Tax=Gordonia sp. (in: high G+C Gram-positive bacteria) TaxID=84139 RepID=UPI0039E31AB3
MAVENRPARRDIEIACDDHVLAGWHYPPSPSPELVDADGRSPVVVLAHGYSLTRDSGLARYAERFADAGFHAVVFDYSGFGDSEGEPREVVSVTRQLRDWEAAIAAARALDAADPRRVALWGTSYSGGLVVAAATKDGGVGAVVAQVPNLDNLATLRFIVKNTSPTMQAWLVASVSRDVAHAILRRKPYYVQAVGPAGAKAAYASDESWAQLSQIAGPEWKNRVGLRDFATLPVFRAVSHLDGLPCRIQFWACDRDDLTPVQPTLDAASKLGDRAELHRMPTGHFGIYLDPYFDVAIGEQTRFLTQELRVGAGPS